MPDLSPEEQELRAMMVAYQAGEMSAFDGLYGALAEPLRRYLWHLSGNAARAEDLLQETFLQIHRSRHTYDGVSPARPWAFAIARHVFLMDLRARGRRGALGAAELPPDLPIPADADGLPDRDELRRALARVTGGRRDAVLLHHLHGFTFREIGGILGIGEQAAKLRASRGMADLRALLTPRGRKP